MVDVWKPVSGTFWISPPEPDVEVLSVWYFLLLAFAIAVVLVAIMWRHARNSKPIREPSQQQGGDSSDEPEQEQASTGWHLRDHLGKVGAAVTYIYLVVIAAMIWGRSGQLLTMPLNELGDFLAGAFGPVAFLWLVLGFLQQGDELRQGTEALKLQATELKNSVEQQSIMAKAAITQMAAQEIELEHKERQRQLSLCASFTLQTTGFGSGSLPGTVSNKLQIRNDGSLALKTHFTLEPPLINMNKSHLGDFRTSSSSEFDIIIDPAADPPHGVAILSYEDKEGNERVEMFSYIIKNSNISFKKLRDS